MQMDAGRLSLSSWAPLTCICSLHDEMYTLITTSLMKSYPSPTPPRLTVMLRGGCGKGAVGGWGGVGEAEGGGALNQLTLTRLQTGGGEMTSITKSERISIFQIRRQLPGGTRACHVKSSTLRGLSFFPRSPPSSIVSTVGAHQMNAVSWTVMSGDGKLRRRGVGGWDSSGGGGVDGETQRTLLKVSIIWAAKFTRGCLAW